MNIFFKKFGLLVTNDVNSAEMILKIKLRKRSAFRDENIALLGNLVWMAALVSVD